MGRSPTLIPTLSDKTENLHEQIMDNCKKQGGSCRINSKATSKFRKNLDFCQIFYFEKYIMDLKFWQKTQAYAKA